MKIEATITLKYEVDPSDYEITMLQKESILNAEAVSIQTKISRIPVFLLPGNGPTITIDVKEG